MLTYSFRASMAVNGFGFSIIADVEADDMPAAMTAVAEKMRKAKADRPELQFREVQILAPTIVGKGTDENHH
jgi:hypothetical protein